MADDYITDGLPAVTREDLERLAQAGVLNAIVEHLKLSRANLQRKAFQSVTDWDGFNRAKGAERMLNKCIDFYQKLLREAAMKQTNEENNNG